MNTREYVAATSLEEKKLTSPAYSPSVFSHVKSPKKGKAKKDLRKFSRHRENNRRIEGFERERIEVQHRQRERKIAEERVGMKLDRRERERVEENRSETAEALVELSTLEVSQTLSTMTEMTHSVLAAIEQAASEKDILSRENICLKDVNASLCKQISLKTSRFYSRVFNG